MGARFNFGKKEDAEYTPYGSEFTMRQKRIIFGLPVDGLRLQEISIIVRKAKKLDMPDVAEMVFDRYEEMFTGRSPPKYSIAEAIM